MTTEPKASKSPSRSPAKPAARAGSAKPSSAKPSSTKAAATKLGSAKAAAASPAAAKPASAKPSAKPEPKPPRAQPVPLTQRQEARRRRILDASTRLACGGGFDAVQMREVAEISGVALGTLYRYFPSKIHLLVATMEDQLGLLHDALRERPPATAVPADRVAETLLRAFRALQREPQLADAMVRALIFADRSVSAEVESVARLTATIILDAMRLDAPPTAEQLSAVRVIEHTWHAALVTWLSGRASVDEVTVDLRTVCRLIDPANPANRADRTNPAAPTAPGAPPH